MRGLELWFNELIESKSNELRPDNDSISLRFVNGGLFLESTVPCSFASFVSTKCSLTSLSCSRRDRRRRIGGEKLCAGGFLSVSLSIKGSTSREGFGQESSGVLGQSGVVTFEEVKKEEVRFGGGGGALNITKHLWAGAVAAMVSRFV